MHTLENSEDPDEMPNNAEFHQGLHWLLRQKQSSEKEMQKQSSEKETQILFGKKNL